MAQRIDTVVLSGAGPHADPWHPLPETSARLAELVGPPGSVEIVTSIDRLGAALDGVDLLIVNASANRTTPIGEDDQFGRTLDAFLARGGNLLATHSATIAFPGLASWRSTIGATWEHGRTSHPPIGRSLIRRSGAEHPITGGLGDFEVHDERYMNLDLVDNADVEPLYVHEEGGVVHPLVWARTVGRSRVVYNALGHDPGSYDSPGHVALIGRITSWLRHRR
ncbi:ThuA domain-containing protein [Micromonospora sp. NBC_01796]|uniref:ThuA domain-containing protein n=1 Tax=Micromonospora sp. NBC_01796 TaxID=2975987 RepID=UPI002DDB9739|nr:ThuA domain-containing protein [Micromonospora sp. NBC_01796]WSA84175.1 ThuA domain-containing protein [Micromonospora sp. NBC_01796]